MEEGKNNDFTFITGINDMVDIAQRMNIFIYSLAGKLYCF